MKRRCNLLNDNILEKLQGGLPAIALPSITALNSAFCNDVDPELVYAQSLMSLARENDVLIAISTSGNSKNVYCCAMVAKSLGIKVIGLTGKLKTVADICICVPENETYKIQELHLPIYHCICAAVEKYFLIRLILTEMFSIGWIYGGGLEEGDKNDIHIVNLQQ